jgi:NADH dehydrogenase FAD-containing subunit
MTNKLVKEITDKGVFFEDGKFLDSNAVIWATGA